MTAKLSFITSYQNILLACDNSLLFSMGPAQQSHNEVAKIYRKGICVISFNLLEDFIKNRLGEIFKKIHEAQIGFNSLPDKIKEASTINVLKAVLYQSKILKKNNEDWIGLIQEHTKYINSTSNSEYQLSDFSLGWDKPNIISDDVANFLKTFGAKKPWVVATEICSRVGIAIPSPKDLYLTATERRHKSAHESCYDPNYSDMLSFSKDMIGIALSVDIIITYALKLIQNQDYDFIDGDKKINAKDLNFRFIDEHSNGKWREIKEGGIQATKIHLSKDDAIAFALQRNLPLNEFIIVRNQQSIPIEWHYKQ